MRSTVNTYVAILAITVLGGIASLTIVHIATDVSYGDSVAGIDYAVTQPLHHKAVTK